jgi:tripartite ATP-independent transporter DctP family solute receptor
VFGRSRAWRSLLVVAALALTLGVVSACGGGGGGGGSENVTLRLAYVTPEAHPYGQAVDYFIQQVDEMSNGTVKITGLPSYPNGDIPLLDAVKGGSVDMGSVSSAVWGTKGVHTFDALQMPFLLGSYPLEGKVIGGDIGKEMLKGADDFGVVGLAIHEGGLRKPLGVNKKLVTLADFKNLKMRSVEAPVLSAGLQALGANPTSLPVTEIFQAMQNHTVDGMEANLGLIQTYKLYEVAEYVTANVNLWPFPTVLIMNKAKFDSLSEDQQKAIQDAAALVPDFSIKIFTEPTTDLVKTLCDEGLKFAVAAKEDVAAMVEATKPVYAQFQKDPDTDKFVTAIQDLKAQEGPPPAPAPLPAGCAA